MRPRCYGLDCPIESGNDGGGVEATPCIVRAHPGPHFLVGYARSARTSPKWPRSGSWRQAGRRARLPAALLFTSASPQRRGRLCPPAPPPGRPRAAADTDVGRHPAPGGSGLPAVGRRQPRTVRAPVRISSPMVRMRRIPASSGAEPRASLPRGGLVGEAGFVGSAHALPSLPSRRLTPRDSLVYVRSVQGRLWAPTREIHTYRSPGPKP